MLTMLTVFDEEIFGPIAAIIKVNDREEALMMVAEFRFDLGTMLVTKDGELRN